jgi:hypothetical protein
MALTKLQSDILRCLAKNRSATSYLAGGIMLNKNWQRRSDDIDIFHDTDEEVTAAAEADIATLEAAVTMRTATLSSTAPSMRRSPTGSPKQLSSGSRRRNAVSFHW